MKSIFNKALIGVLALLPVFASCEKEPEVGTPLYPVEEEYMGPMVYFYNSASSPTISSQIVKTPGGLVIPEDTIMIYPQLTQTLDKDVTVYMVEDTELSKQLSTSNTVALPEGSLSFAVPSVVIKAGTKRAEEPIKVVLQECDAVSSFSDFAVSAVRLATDEEGVRVSKQYSTYTWNLSMKELNVKRGTEEGKKIINPSEYTVSANNTWRIDRLTDGKYEAGWYGKWFAFEFAKEEEVTSVYIHPVDYGSWSGWGYSVTKAEVFTSNDGETWKSHGELEFTDYVKDMTVPTVIEFYKPVKCKHLKVQILAGEDVSEIAVTRL